MLKLVCQMNDVNDLNCNENNYFVLAHFSKNPMACELRNSIIVFLNEKIKTLKSFDEKLDILSYVNNLRSDLSNSFFLMENIHLMENGKDTYKNMIFKLE